MYTYILNSVRSLAETIGLVKKCSEVDEQLDKVDDLIKEIDKPIEKVIDEPYENKHIYRKFSVKSPYSGPPQIMLPHNEELVKVYENGQYISMRESNFEDYGTDDEDEKIKVIYNILVEH
jgi:nicotinic acid phosphoribosyltransferase